MRTTIPLTILPIALLTLGCGIIDQINGTAPTDGGPVNAGAAAVALGFTPSNLVPGSVDLSGVRDCVISSAECRINTDDGTVNCLADGSDKPFRYAKVMQATGGGNVGVFVCNTLRIEPAASARVVGSLPLLLVANKVQIAGELTANAGHDTAQGGGFATQSGAHRGGGPGGGSPVSQFGGAGGGAFCGRGGNGGVGVGTVNPGGSPYGTPQLIPLLGGAGGGSNSYGAGAGGGAIEIVAGQITIEATGVVAAGGGGGWGNEGAGGGGGAGGAILLEAPMVSVAGTLAVNGGAGGQGHGADGGPNATPDGRPAIGAGVSGGQGSAGASTDGSDARMIDGGGGGGAGRIRVNSRTGAASITGTLSPAAGTACVSEGQLPS
jgi:hypothetical protein